jgi:hypothetical protein
VETIRKWPGKSELSLAAVLLWQACAPQLILAQAKDPTPHEVGIVYYAEGSGFKPIDKQKQAMGGKPIYSGKVKGPRSALRLIAGQPQIFRVCGVDPTRYTMYTFRSTKDLRVLSIAKVALLTAKATFILSESEVPVTIKTADSGCFEITPKKSLEAGEYGFNPLGSDDVFMFGVDDAMRTK